MAVNLGFEFNPTEHDIRQSSGQLPVGVHKVVITKAEATQAKSGKGGFLALSLRVVDGDAVGASGLVRLNLFNQNQIAVDIAKRQLATIAYSIGQVTPFNVADALYNRPFKVEVVLQAPPNEKGYTEVIKYMDAAGNEPGSTPSAGQATSGFGAAAPAQSQYNPGAPAQAGMAAAQAAVANQIATAAIAANPGTPMEASSDGLPSWMQPTV